MNTERMDEVAEQQVKLNKILAKWDITMNESHYYSLKDTVADTLAYVMDNTDVKPKINPLVEVYYKQSII